MMYLQSISEWKISRQIQMWPQINTKGEESVGRERTAAMLSRIEHVRGETIKNIYIHVVLGHT